MPTVIDLVCKTCGTEFPKTYLRGTVQSAVCSRCNTATLRATWKRGEAPTAQVFRAVALPDGSEIASEEELAFRAGKVLRRSDPGARVICEDDPAAAKARIEELRHDTWERRHAMGIDAALMAEADAEGRALKAERDAEAARRNISPEALKQEYTGASALDRAKVARFGTTDPVPQLVQQGLAESKADFETPRPEAAGWLDKADQSP